MKNIQNMSSGELLLARILKTVPAATINKELDRRALAAKTLAK